MFNNIFYRASKKYCFLLLVFLGAGSTIIACLPLFKGGAWIGHDYVSHVNRMISTVDYFNVGQIFSYYDYNYRLYPGYSWNLFYPPLMNIIMSGIYWVSGSVIFSIKTACFFVVFISFINSFITFCSLTSKLKSFYLSLLFCFSVYSVGNFFIRAAFPEALAMSFIPLLFLGLYDSSKIKSIFLISISVSGILLSNIPSFLCSMLVITFACIFNPHKIICVFCAALISIGITSFYFFPLLFSLVKGDDIYMSSKNWFDAMMICHINIIDLLSAHRIKSQNLLYNMRLGLGWPFSIVLIIGIIYRKSVDWLLLLLIIMVLFIVVGIDYSFLPWPINEVFSKIQFSWRMIGYLVVVSLFIIALSGIKKKFLLAALIGTLFIDAHISWNKEAAYFNESNYYLPAQKDSYSDYILMGSKPYIEWEKFLDCYKNDDNFKMAYKRRFRKNSVIYDIERNRSYDYCLIPMMAYNSVSIKNQVRKVKDGYLVYENNGSNNAVVEITDEFKKILYISYGLSLLSVISIVVFFIRRKLVVK